MIHKARTATVRQLPVSLDSRGKRDFYQLLQDCIDVDRPRLVFDCCQLRELDASGIHFLLCCLEEAMKRNGDIRLAAMLPAAKASLDGIGADRIFEVFDTITDAVDSYTQPRGSLEPPIPMDATQAA